MRGIYSLQRDYESVDTEEARDRLVWFEGVANHFDEVDAGVGGGWGGGGTAEEHNISPHDRLVSMRLSHFHCATCSVG